MLSLNLRNFWQNIKQSLRSSAISWLAGLKKDRFLLVALFVGLALRALNPTFGSPSLYISNDEAIAHLSALNMLANKTPVSIANYTPLGAYVQIPFLLVSFLAMIILGYVNNVNDFGMFILTHEGYFLFIPRLISALFGTLIILVVYRISKELFGKTRTAIIAAFLTAISFNLVHISHFGRPWSPSLFFMVLAVYLAIKKKVLPAYLSIAISYGFHQSGILGIPLIFLLTKNNKGVTKYSGLLICFLTTLLLSSLTLKTGVIESILRGQSFIRLHVLITDFLSGNFDFPGSFINTFKSNLSLYFVLNLFVTDGVLIFFGILGMTFALGKRFYSKVIIFYIACYFLFASLFFFPLIRYLLPILILLIPYAANFLSNTFKKNAAIVFILLIAGINSFWWTILYLRKPTFIAASEWIDNNVSPETAIAYTGTRYRIFLPNSRALAHMHEANDAFYAKLGSFVDSRPLENVRNIVYISVFPGNNKQTMLANTAKDYNISYVVDYYIDPDERFLNQMPEKFELVRVFAPTTNGLITGIPEPLFDSSWNFPFNDNRPKVSMYSLSNTGPYFDILKYKK